MATNEIYRHSDWIPLPVIEGTVNGSPVLVGGLVGVAQEVGGIPVTWSIGGTSTTPAANLTVMQLPASNHLEPGYASVALTGAWAFEIEGAEDAAVGTIVGIIQGSDGEPATLTVGAEGQPFGHLINWTTDGRAIVRLMGGMA